MNFSLVEVPCIMMREIVIVIVDLIGFQIPEIFLITCVIFFNGLSDNFENLSLCRDVRIVNNLWSLMLLLLIFLFLLSMSMLEGELIRLQFIIQFLY